MDNTLFDLDVAQPDDLGRNLSKEFPGLILFPRSYVRLTSFVGVIGAFQERRRRVVLVVRTGGTPPELPGKVIVEKRQSAGLLKIIEADTPTILRLSEAISWLRPRTNPGKPSVGLGDCLGGATAALVRGLENTPVFPVLALQTPRDVRQSGRTWSDVLADAAWGVWREGWKQGFGAEAEDLRTREDVEAAAAGGFVRFSLNLSELLVPVHGKSKMELSQHYVALEREWPVVSEWRKRHLGQGYTLSYGTLRENFIFDERTFFQVAVRLGKVIQQAVELSAIIRSATRGRPHEIAVDLRHSARPIAPAEHLFLALELAHHGVRLAGFVPQLPMEFVDGIDYVKNPGKLVKRLTKHCYLAAQFGGHSVGLPGAGDKLSLLPKLKDSCPDVSIKMCRTFTIEGLRVLARKAPELFEKVVVKARTEFDSKEESRPAIVDAGHIPLPSSLRPEEIEKEYFDTREGRLLLGASFEADSGAAQRLRSQMNDILCQYEELHFAAVEGHARKHLEAMFQKSG